jgi:energy-coupling factor transport system ATP-binding protein
MPAGPLLEVEGLTFRYRRAAEPAVRDLTLSLDAGEVLLVAGPSGCGKSTLIRAINGLIPHAYRGDLAGSVRLEGRPTADMRLREIALLVGTMLQDPAKQIVGSSVEGELAFGPENLGLDRGEIRRRIGEVMERTGIGSLAGRETAWLSGGEQQLLAMAGTLMMRPRLFVIDEPLANLDPATASRLLGVLRDLADEGHAVVIVEHRVEEALELRPDRVLYLDAGQASYLGDVDGFLRVADPEAVKLPFPIVLEHHRAAGAAAKASASSVPSVADPGDPRLAYERVAVDLGERRVLDDVSATFGSREIVAVLGPNGSGKTTMLRAAMRLVEPVAGRMMVDGQAARSRTTAELARIFGYVFQSPSQMLFARTVREELLFGPRNMGILPPHPEALAVEALDRTGLSNLEGILDRPPLTLSFGQQKRLALAIALALRPPTLVLDEPSAGQDHRSSAAFMVAIRAIPGLESIYLITHDVDLALSHADRILVLRDGRVAADGPPMRVIEDEDRWFAANLHRTSLIDANRRWRNPEERFLDASALARLVLQRERLKGPAEDLAAAE